MSAYTWTSGKYTTSYQSIWVYNVAIMATLLSYSHGMHALASAFFSFSLSSARLSATGRMFTIRPAKCPLRDSAQAYLHYVINTRNKKSPSSAPWYFLHCNVVYFCLKVIPRVCQFSFSSCKAKSTTTNEWYVRSVINSYSTSPCAVMHSSQSHVIRRNADRGQNWQVKE